jgi:DNA-binding beta-propeller fold protein YncE
VAMTRSVTAGPDLGAIAVIDTAANAVIATIPVGSMPTEVVVSPDGRALYVPNRDGHNGRGVLSIIDTTTHTVTDSVAVSGRGGGPKGAAVTRTAPGSTCPPTWRWTRPGPLPLP